MAFTTRDADLIRELNAVQREQNIRRASHEAEARRNTFSGPFREMSATELFDAAEARVERNRRFAASPNGRFFEAVKALEMAGHVGPADRAYCAYSRGFNSPDRPADLSEVEFARKVLAPVDHPAARAALAALGEIDGQARKAA